ncbi:hypothetical protein HWV62_24766 [Athelia sp. TMB]|nr:hypothetical protein HWV62_24766 [Athelia sp. TMB]
MPSTFFAAAVLFDMDGTLTDSIAAVEAAWGKVAADLGLDPAVVIAATHGKRAIDNLAEFKPHLKAHEVDAEVDAFERTILYYADAFNEVGPGSKFRTTGSTPSSVLSSGGATPALTDASSGRSSLADVMAPIAADRRPSFGVRLNNMLADTLASDPGLMHETVIEDVCTDDYPSKKQLREDLLSVWQQEASSVDRRVRILPSVREIIDSIPEGRYAVATSGAKIYAYGCMSRVGIVPPKVTITGDDSRLKRGKPAPDPFLLAAKELGFPASDCVVFEDSPSGIRSGVASGATVIAVCTSHERSKIENCGAHYIVQDMSQVTCEAVGTGADMQLRFTVQG